MFADCLQGISLLMASLQSLLHPKVLLVLLAPLTLHLAPAAAVPQQLVQLVRAMLPITPMLCYGPLPPVEPQELLPPLPWIIRNLRN